MAFLVPLSTLILVLAEQGPEPEDVKAGWTAFALFLLLAVAVALLGRSLIKHLRKAAANEQAGAFDRDEDREQPVDRQDHGPQA